MIELDALRDLRALVLRIQALREHELEPRPISLEEWQAVLKAAAAATTPETFKPSSIADAIITGMKVLNCAHDWRDAGECLQGCCDRWRCEKCGATKTEEIPQ